MDRDTFVVRTVEWINGTLVPAGRHDRCRHAALRQWLIDSIRVLQLIAWTEHALVMRIPDARIRMDHFRTVRHIADAFAGADTVPEATMRQRDDIV
jgi:hypothetical protein